MGNILCKNRTNKNTTRTKSPVDRICPQGIGKKKHFWEKHILETSPAHSQMPKDDKDGWQNAALTVPNNDQNSKELDRPVAPPRKKRSSKLHKDEHIKNGFEDVFLGDKDNLKSKSLSNINTNNNSIHIDKPSSPTTNSLSKLNSNSNDMIETNNKTTATTLPRKISKVGNKKSDKFFGENLSDCLSDEILPTPDKIILVENITTENNDIIKSSEKNNEDETDNVLEINNENETVFDVGIEEEELLRKINKERGKLMFSIEKQIDKTNQDDEERYKGEVPVEEEIIVPVKKIYKHICNDDDAMHIRLHLNNNIDNISTNPSGPKKPQRDLAKYKNSLNRKDIKETSQKENQSSIELNKNQMKCDHGTQTGKRVINNEDNKNKTEIMDHITQQAKLAINDILKSAEAAVEHQMNNELLKSDEKINKYEKEIKSIEKKENNVDSIKLSDELIIHNNEDYNNIKSSPTSDKNFNLLISTEPISPEIKIDYNTISNNISPDRNENSKTEDQLENDLSKSQPSPRPVRSSEIIPPNLSNSEKIFRRCLSTQSYLTSDLIEKIALQANILSLPGGFSPEDALQCNDGSGLVSPNFKLDQKRSLSPQISTIGDKNDIETKPIQKIESTENVNIITDTEKSSSDYKLKLQEKSENNNDTNLIEKNIDIKTKIINNNTNGNTASKHMPRSKIEKRVIRTPNRQLSKDNSCTPDYESKRDVSEAIKTFLNKKDLRPQEIFDLLQDEFGDCIFSQCLPPEDKLIIEDLQKSIKESEIETTLTPTETKKSFKFTEKKHIKSPEKHKISKIPVLTTNKSLENLNFNDKRRHSIDDLNAWFTPEKDFPLRKRKREASLPGSLDIDELFNGKINHANLPIKSILIEQENEENIEKSANKLVDDILSKAENNIKSKENKQTIAQEKEQGQSDVKDNDGNSGKSHKDLNGNSEDFHIGRKSDSADEDDHSALLKFLEHEKLNNL